LRKVFGDERGSARYIETISKRGYRLVAPVERIVATNGVSPPNLGASSLPEGLPVAPSPASGNHETEALQPSQLRKFWHSGEAHAASGETTGPQTKHARLTTSRPLVALLAGGIIAAIATAAFTVVSQWREPTALTRDRVELSPLRAFTDEPSTKEFVAQTQASVKSILATNHVQVADTEGTHSTEGARAEFKLGGTVERIGESYSATLTFDSQNDGQTLWSRNYVRPIANSVELREEIGITAAAVIHCALEKRSRVKADVNLPTLKIYLEACDFAHVPQGESSDEGYTRLEAIAERLIRVAPGDPNGFGMAAEAQAWKAGLPDLTDPQRESHRQLAREMAARALEIEPNNPNATFALAQLVPVRRWLERESYYNRVGPQLPRRSAGVSYVLFLRQTGRVEEAARYVAQLATKYPVSAEIKAFQAVIEMQRGRYAEVQHLMEDILRRWPNDKGASFYKLVGASFYADQTTAKRELESYATTYPLQSQTSPCWLAFIEAKANSEEPAKIAAFRQACIAEDSGDDTFDDYRIRMLAALGDVDAAYELANRKSFDWVGSTIFLFYPEMSVFRADVRFMPLMAKSGLLEYWQDSGRWPDFCADTHLPYDCKTAVQQALVGVSASQ
jgi:hypothetical protein